jgi:cytochrome oxidase Cu insertion factor (SCO1/SenC/PrrC family)|tara:strand:- start:423 stop:791 length:369 start_codon:yes stop_codon:yes gene_type:complete
MFGIRLLLIGIVSATLIGAGAYVLKLRSDNAILKANQIKLEGAIETQKEVIENQKQDYEKIISINKELNDDIIQINKSKQILQDKLSKHDLNYLAVEKPGLIEKIINKGSNKIMDELNEATR